MYAHMRISDNDYTLIVSYNKRLSNKMRQIIQLTKLPKGAVKKLVRQPLNFGNLSVIIALIPTVKHFYQSLYYFLNTVFPLNTVSRTLTS